MRNSFSHKKLRMLRREQERDLISRHVNLRPCYRTEARWRKAKQLAVSVSGFKRPVVANAD